MGILITAVVIISLLLATRSAIKGYEAEVRKQPNPTGPDSALDPSFLTSDAGFSGEAPQHHGIHHSDPSCVDSHHGDVILVGTLALTPGMAMPVDITSGAGVGIRTTCG